MDKVVLSYDLNSISLPQFYEVFLCIATILVHVTLAGAENVSLVLKHSAVLGLAVLKVFR